MVGMESDANFGGVVSLPGAIAGCHSNVLWWGGKVMTNFGGVGVVPLLGAIAGCQSLFHINIFLLYLKTTMNFVLNFLQTLHRSLH